MSFLGALVGGVVGTLVLTTALRGASELRLTRIDIPFLLGTALTEDRVRAKGVGYVLHFVFGVVFAAGYWMIFRVTGQSGWWAGALLGALHGLFATTVLVNVLLPLVHPRMANPLTAADSTPLLETPGFLMMNYGSRTPVVTLGAHIAYGAIVGGFHSLAG